MQQVGGPNFDRTESVKDVPTAITDAGIPRNQPEAKRIGLDLTSWESRIQELMHAGAKIITFRGGDL